LANLLNFIFVNPKEQIMQTIPASPQTKRQGGYTIIELSIVLAIIGVLIVGGLLAVNSLLLSSKANKQIEDSGRAMGKLQAMLSSTTVSGLTTSGAIGMGLFPSTRVSDGTVKAVVGVGNEFVRSNSGTALTSTDNGIDLSLDTGAVYTLTGIPKAVCADIASSLANMSAAAYVYSSTPVESDAGKSTHLTKANAIKEAGGSVKGASAGTQCNAAETLSMSFVMRP
jgi:prepilin-type N-terminal cleavage/methylation domain-containing protein